MALKHNEHKGILSLKTKAKGGTIHMISLSEAKQMSDMNYSFFKSNIDNLCKSYYGKYLSLKNASVLGSFDSFDQAYNETIKTEELGTFLIVHCVKSGEMPVNNFYSNNVVFN